MKLPLTQTITAFAGVAILCTMGGWQVHRLHWKEDIVHELQSQYEASPKANITRASLQPLEDTPLPLLYGQATGHLLLDKAILLGPKTDEGRSGYHLIVPLDLTSGGTMLVNLGWVPEVWKDNTMDRLAMQPRDEITVTGLARKPDWNSFSSKNSPGNDMWFRADVREIAKAKDLDSPSSLILYAEAATPPLDDVVMQEGGWLPYNKHRQYAFFWFSLAGVLVIIFAAYCRSRRQVDKLTPDPLDL